MILDNANGVIMAKKFYNTGQRPPSQTTTGQMDTMETGTTLVPEIIPTMETTLPERKELSDLEDMPVQGILKGEVSLYC